MPKYEVDIDGQMVEVDSDQPLSDEQAAQYAMTQQAPTPTSGVLGSTGRRVNEAVDAGLSLPKNLWQTVSGGGEDGRFASAMKSLQGVAAPASVLLSPVGGLLESTARDLGANEGWSRLAGDVGEGVSTLGLGFAAKAGKLGAYGQQFAKAVGAGRTSGTLAEQLPHDPQLRFAVGREAPQVANPLEALARSDAPLEELALSLKSPALAENFLMQRQAKADLWQNWARNGQMIDEIPEDVKFTPQQLLEFQPPPKRDSTLFATLGTPTNVAARTNPLAAQASYEMALGEMGLKKAITNRHQRNEDALTGLTDNEMRLAIRARETLTPAEIAKNANINPSVQGVLTWLDNKFAVDKGIIVPRLREQFRARIEGQVEKELQTTAHGWGEKVDAATLARTVDERVKKAIPDNWGLDQYFTHIFPGHYKVMNKEGGIIGTGNTRLEAKHILHDAVLDGADIKTLSVETKAYFDADLLKLYQGRVKRSMDSVAKGLAFDPDEILAAGRGEFGVSNKFKFFGPLLERQGNGKGYLQDLKAVLDTYDRGLERWTQLTDLSAKVTPLLTELGARGYTGVAGMLTHSLQRLWGYHSPVSQYFDNTLQAMPVINNLVAPMALERWAGGLKSGIVNTFLRYNPRFHAVNATQTLSTLWPISGGSVMTEGAKLAMSDVGKSLVARHLPEGSRVEGFAKGLGPSEKLNQNLSFLTMYNKARKLGLNDQQAADYGKLRGNLYTQFMGLTTDVPHAFSKLDPFGIATLFQRFPIKQTELLFDVIKDKNFPAAAKWMGVNMALGGFKAASLGQAGYLTQKLYKQVEKEYGETVADLFHTGLPSLIGVDLSNSVMLLNPPFGDGWAEKAGNLIGGVTGSVSSSVLGAMAASTGPEPNVQKRAFDALVQRLPAAKQLSALRRLWEDDYDFKDPLGRLRFKGDYADAWKQLMGARSTKEANLDTEIGAVMEIKERYQDVINYAASRYGQSKLAGIPLGKDMEDAVKREVDNWNSMYPEFPITGEAISKRSQARMKQASKTLRERVLGGAPKVLRQAEVFQDESYEQIQAPTGQTLIPPGGG